MGGRGSTSGNRGSASAPPISFTSYTNTNNANINQVFQQLQQQMQDPTPSVPPVNDNVYNTLSQMTDDELATLVKAAKTIDMPNHIGDVDDLTQRFVYAAGLNEKPQTMTASEMRQYMQQNGISQSEMLARSISANTITVNGTQIVMSADMIKAQFTDGKYNYIGGKYGGQAVGAGTYFDQNGGHSTGYGSDTMIAILSPTAKVIDLSMLKTKAQSFANSHPQFARQVGQFGGRPWGGGKNNYSIYALAMGYNVIKRGSYFNIIDREAVIVRK